MQRCLMLGAGHTEPKRKLCAPTSAPEDQTIWTTLDMNPAAKPDILYDLWDTTVETRPIPCAANTFDEIHAYSVLEHFGEQGDFQSFFNGFREFWRVLKPGGYLIAGVPAWDDLWAWSDPGHTRVITHGTIAYLTREHYETGLGCTPSSDYRAYVEPCWWRVVHSEYLDEEKDGVHVKAYYFALEKVA